MLFLVADRIQERERAVQAAASEAAHNQLAEKINQVAILRESNASLRSDCEANAKRARQLENDLRQVTAELDPTKEQLRIAQAEIEARSSRSASSRMRLAGGKNAIANFSPRHVLHHSSVKAILMCACSTTVLTLRRCSPCRMRSPDYKVKLHRRKKSQRSRPRRSRPILPRYVTMCIYSRFRHCSRPTRLSVLTPRGLRRYKRARRTIRGRRTALRGMTTNSPLSERRMHSYKVRWNLLRRSWMRSNRGCKRPLLSVRLSTLR